MKHKYTTHCLCYIKEEVLKPLEITLVRLLFMNFFYERECDREETLAMNKGAKTSTELNFASRAVSVKTVAALKFCV